MFNKSEIENKIYPRVANNDVQWFDSQLNNLSQIELNYALNCCLYFTSSWELTDKIIHFGANNLARFCYTNMTLGNYQILQNTMEKYSQPKPYGKKINLYSHKGIHLGCCAMATMLEKENRLELFQMILDGLPNHTQHTQKAREYKDNNTYNYKRDTYSQVYNSNLNVLIKLYGESAEDEKKDIYRQGIMMMLNKKFPLSDDVINTIQEYHLEEMFGSRLNNKKRDRTYPQGLAHRRFLLSNSKVFLQSLTKEVVYHDFIGEFQIPTKITNYMLYAFQHYPGKAIPSEEEWDFFHTLYQSENKMARKLFWFFDRYYFLEKRVFYYQLNKQLIDIHHVQPDDNHQTGAKI